MLSAESLDGKLVAVLFSHAAHPVIVHSASTMISADYPGFAVKTARRESGSDGLFLFAQGCSGNINGFPLKGGLDAAAAAGRDLGQAVVRALNRGAQPLRFDRLRAVASEIRLPFQPPPPVEELEEQISAENNAEKRKRFQELLNLAKKADPPAMRFPMRAVHWGDFCLLGLPHEPFSEYHHFVERASPLRHNMVLGYTNGLECYVGTRKDYELGNNGGYETSPRGAAFMFESRLPLAPETEEIIHAGIQKLLSKLTRQS